MIYSKSEKIWGFELSRAEKSDWWKERSAQMSIGCIKRLSESWLICNQRVCHRLGGARRPERRREIEASSGYATEADGSGFLIFVCRWHDEISLISRSTSPPRFSGAASPVCGGQKGCSWIIMLVSGGGGGAGGGGGFSHNCILSSAEFE